MIDLKALLSIGFIVAVIVWRCGPKRSELWRHLIEGLDWLRARCEDALIVAELRESRRDSRRKPRQTSTVIDNGVEWNEFPKGGAA